MTFLPFAAVAEAEDEDVADSELGVVDVTEGRLNLVFVTEGCPNSEEFVSSGGGLAGGGTVVDLHRRHEVSAETISGRSRSSCQGVGCG